MRKLTVMRRIRTGRLALVLTALVVAAPFVACGLDEGGFAPDDGNDIDSGLPDVTIPDTSSGTDTGVPDSDPGDVQTTDPCALGDAGACPARPNDGWEPVGYLDDEGAQCATGLDASTQIADPNGGSCGCSDTCNVGTKCQVGPLTNVRWNDNSSGSCNSQENDAKVTFPPGSNCYRFGSDHSMSHFGATPPPSDGASCSYDGVPDTSTFVKKQVHVCSSQRPECRGTFCAQPHACIAKNGTNDCPKESNGKVVFSVKHTLSDGADLACGSCGCSVTCSAATTLHTSDQADPCGGDGDAVQVDNGCHSIDQGGFSRTYRWLKYVPTESCSRNATPPPTPTINKTGSPRTVCCKP